MKKLTLALCFLISGVTVNALADILNNRNIFVPKNLGSFTFGLTGVYWRYSSPTLDFDPIAVFTDNFTSDHSPRFKHNDYDWGFKAKVGYIIPCSANEISLTYTYYNNDENKRFKSPGSFILPDVPFTGTLLVDGGDFLDPAEGILPLSQIPLPLNFLQVHREIENQTWDLDFNQSINVGCNFRIRWFGGVRYTHLENKFNARFEAVNPGTIVANFDSVTVADLFFPPPLPVIVDITAAFNVTGPIRETVNLRSDFNGVGPRFGTEVDYQIFGGFGIVGSIATSLLVGEIDNSIRRDFENGIVTLLADASTGVVVDPLRTDLEVGDVLEFDPTSISTPIPASQSLKSSDLTRIVPNIDAKLGLDWNYQFRCSSTRLMVEAGYMVSHYFNAVDRLAIVNIIPSLRNTHDISFDGPYVGIEVAL